MARKKATRKKATRKKRATRGGGGGARDGVERTEPLEVIQENENEDFYVWLFCRTPGQALIDPETSFSKFMDGDMKQFRFHSGGMAAPARKAAIEIFAEDLNEWLLRIGFFARLRAREEITKAASKSTSKVKEFLKVVAEQFRLVTTES